MALQDAGIRNEPYTEALDKLLREPIASVREREQSAFDGLLAGCGRRVVLFGAGNLGRKALECLRSIGVEPLAFADNSSAKWRTQASGVPVLSPGDAAKRYGSSALFVVTIWSLGHFYSETQTMLQSMGCTHVVPSESLRWKFSDQLLPDFCQDLAHKVYEQASDVRKVADFWSDDYSRAEYLKHIRWRALGDLEALSPPVEEQSYFLDTLYHLRDGEVFVDGGAYTGVTAEQVIHRNPHFLRIVALEPDPTNFQRLSEWKQTLTPGVAERIDARNIALSNVRGKLRFSATASEGSCLAKDGNITVDCLPLDELLSHDAPTFIKMDIEGAELDALEGGRQAIRTNRPILAICVYHNQDHLWRIPLLIHEMVEDYRLFLRPHEADGWQLVCYAVPANRLNGGA